ARARRFLAALRPDAALAADLPPLAPAAPDLSVPELRFALPAAPVPRFDHYLEECPGDPVPWNEDPQPWVREVARRAVEAGWPPARDRVAMPDRVEPPRGEVTADTDSAAVSLVSTADLGHEPERAEGVSEELWVERGPGGEDAPITCTELSVTDISPT